MREAAKKDSYEILAMEAMPDHVHILVNLKDSQTVSKCVKDLKGSSANGIFKAIPELKLDAHTNDFWQKSFGSRVVPDNQVKTVVRYIQTQHDRMDKYIKINETPYSMVRGVWGLFANTSAVWLC